VVGTQGKKSQRYPVSAAVKADNLVLSVWKSGENYSSKRKPERVAAEAETTEFIGVTIVQIV